MIKALDVINWLGAKEIPIFGLITLGSICQLWIGYLYLEHSEDIKVK